MSCCHDCNCAEGELHTLGCDMERCPICGGQLVTCSHTDLKRWNDIYDRRIPYIQYPIICQYCGELWPTMFMVPDKEWEKYIEPNMRDKVLCRKCYSIIKNLIEVFLEETK